jgi:hypothetical protein
MSDTSVLECHYLMFYGSRYVLLNACNAYNSTFFHA